MPVIELDRGEFLRFGARRAGRLTAAGLLPDGRERAGAGARRRRTTTSPSCRSRPSPSARAATSTAPPTARRAPGCRPRERRHIDRVASAKRAHILRLDAALGADAPLSGDFETVLPNGAVTTRARILALAEQLETLLVRVYLNGVGYAEDAATRLLLGRLLAYDAQQLAWLRIAAGKVTPAGLPGPIDLEPAAAQLDAFLSTPDFPD